jgi:carbonic anhydrase
MHGDLQQVIHKIVFNFADVDTTITPTAQGNKMEIQEYELSRTHVHPYYQEFIKEKSVELPRNVKHCAQSLYLISREYGDILHCTPEPNRPRPLAPHMHAC